MNDEEMWRDFERSDVADFIRATLAEGPPGHLNFPDHLDFSVEQHAFIASLVSHVVHDLTYELSHKWTTHLINLLVVGEPQMPEDTEFPGAPDPRDTPSSSIP